jgi:hypothetical protein
MNKQKNDKWLDELISRTINTTKPQFDSERWKQKYHKELQMLVSRAEKTSTTKVRLPNILKKPITKLAAAALIIVTISFLITHLGPSEKANTTDVTKVTKSPAELLTVASLNMAYRRGGIKAVEQQCEEAVDKLGPWPAKITVKELLAKPNGT